MKLFLLVVFFVPLISAQFESEACISDYLRSKGFNISKIESEQRHKPEQCNAVVRNKKDQMGEIFREVVEENQELQETSVCIMEIYKFTGLDDILLNENLNASQSLDNAAIPKTNITQSAYDFSFICNVIAILVDSAPTNGTDQFNYCWRKEIIDKHLFSDFNEDNFNADSKWKEFTNFDCSSLIMTSKKKFEKELADILNDQGYKDECVSQKIQDENMAEKILKFSVFKDLKMNKTTEEKFRNNLIETLPLFKQNVDRHCKI